MAQFTVTYSESVQGFPSFYSFIPEEMIGMNNRFFSFKGGELYIHNSDDVDRNNFYGEQFTSNVKLSVNDKVMDNKIFKTVNLEGTHPWDVLIESDIQDTGNIDSEWFVKTEGSFRAFVRNSGGDPIGAADLPLRSMNGIGRASYFIVGATSASPVFPLSVQLDNVSVGDTIYYAQDTDNYATTYKWGTVTAWVPNYGTQIMTLIIDNTAGNPNPTVVDPMVFAVKNAVAESHGVLGHYGIIDITNDATEAIELLGVETEVMISKA